MRRPNRATVADTGLGAAFTEGVNEGFRLLGYVLVICKVGEREKVRSVIKASEVLPLVQDFIGGLRGEHYEVGISIRILSEGDVVESPQPAEVGDLEEGEDPSIEDAEIVE